MKKKMVEIRRLPTRERVVGREVKSVEGKKAEKNETL